MKKGAPRLGAFTKAAAKLATVKPWWFDFNFLKEQCSPKRHNFNMRTNYISRLFIIFGTKFTKAQYIKILFAECSLTSENEIKISQMVHLKTNHCQTIEVFLQSSKTFPRASVVQSWTKLSRSVAKPRAKRCGQRSNYEPRG